MNKSYLLLKGLESKKAKTRILLHGPICKAEHVKSKLFYDFNCLLNHIRMHVEYEHRKQLQTLIKHAKMIHEMDVFV